MNGSAAFRCARCGADLIVRNDRTGHSALMLIGVVLALILLIVGFVVPESAVQQTALFAAAAVVAILARIAQAAKQHEQAMKK
jgi:multisubunit Na+/H+ antiporter MnhB subunit